MSEAWWVDPESAWMAKAACAKSHIDNLAGQVRDFQQSGALQVEAEPQSPGVTAYRLMLNDPSHLLQHDPWRCPARPAIGAGLRGVRDSRTIRRP